LKENCLSTNDEGFYFTTFSKTNVSDYDAQMEINDVIHGLQTGRYKFLSNEAQQIKLPDGTTLNESFNDSKYAYISSLKYNPFSHSIFITNFLRLINEARKSVVLIENEGFGPDQLDIGGYKTVETIINRLHVLNILSKKIFGHRLFINDAYQMQAHLSVMSANLVINCGKQYVVTKIFS
jgi:hypothetical protein